MEAAHKHPGKGQEANDKAEARASKYDLVSELSPGTWRVIRKADRFEFLARDITDELYRPEPTALRLLLDTETDDLGTSLMRLLNHENLVNFVDWIKVNSWRDQPQLTPRHFFLYDFCNAGTLENLLMPSTCLEDPALEADRLRHRREAEGTGKAADEPREPNNFLPESLCWHVLCSVLKALAWLHHGVREDYNPEKNEYEELDASVDWLTVLHRDITVANIFFCHPQTKMETYGLCKLGNLGKAFVSGHVNGIVGDRMAPAETKVLAGRVLDDGQGQQSLRELLQKKDMPEYHPPQWKQPYTILSEYRALGDVLVAMMVRPILAGARHVSYLRDHDQARWTRVFEAAEYSAELKKAVYELMSKDAAEDRSTYHLYLRAARGFSQFRKSDPQGRALVTVERVQAAEADAEARKAAENAQLHRALQDILEKQDVQFAEDTDGPPGANPLQQQLHDELDQAIGEAAGSPYF